MTMSQEPTSEEQMYWKKWIHSRDSNAGDMLVRKYIPLVHYHVQRISAGLPKYVSLEDLKSLGMLGLYDALEKFDPNRDLKFDTYASIRIRGAILDGLRKEDWLPRTSREKAKKIEAVIEKLEQKFMRTVSAKEVADELGISEEEVISVMNEGFFANVLSIDEQPKDVEEKEHSAYSIKDEKTPNPEEYLLKEELYTELENVIKQLNEKEQLVISLFYKEELTLTEIGQILGLSTSRISQIHSKALFKLRGVLEKFIEK
jgi:RNA polymerase sigma factor FliA